ncbi:hypothetical protein [Micromonospora sp. LOL_015]|uniref:CRISPR-associated endonuclease Cas2 n=1 Tax=Micromonospora sp. LOL_015 TaxID=3345416 RepID=UPI003A88438B
MNRPVLVVYDIVNDRRRAEVRARLGPIADRFQYSGWLPARQPHRLTRQSGWTAH